MNLINAIVKAWQKLSREFCGTQRQETEDEVADDEAQEEAQEEEVLEMEEEAWRRQMWKKW